jgi:D-alanyl-lipoteichoic acid acyltransferase DltB (MBOAT superfamily)
MLHDDKLLNGTLVKIIIAFMLCLFRYKMFFVVKYFQQNHFSEKKNNNFPENIFQRLVHMKKSLTAKNHR